jgi:hypothetical protein
MIEFIAQYWVGVLFGFIISILSGIGISIKLIFRQFKAIKLGMQAMLRDGIINQYNKYIERDYIPIYALENVTAMYEQYHALGGNGTITQLYVELKELSHKRGENHEGENSKID